MGKTLAQFLDCLQDVLLGFNRGLPVVMKTITPRTTNQRRLLRRYRRHAIRRAIAKILFTLSIGDTERADQIQEAI